jgi:carboxyl-terminal processing protease
MKIRCIQLFLVAALFVQLSFAAEEPETFGGIGIVVAQLFDQDTKDHRGELVVLGFGPDSPASKAGVRPGDVIVAIDGRTTAGSAFAEIVQKELRGPPDKELTLRIRRVGKEDLLEIKVRRTRMKG